MAVLNPPDDEAAATLADGEISPELLSVNAAGFMSILAIDVDLV